MLVIGQQPEEALQRPIQQGGVEQIGAEVFTDGRGIEVGDGAVGAGNVNVCHGPETIAVVETRETGEMV